MHEAVREYVQRFATDEAISLLDIGGRSVNGTGRSLFPNAKTTVLDIREGDDVDIVADAASWEPNGKRWDLILCTEVFEHTDACPAICRTAYRACRRGGRLVVTCAGPGRAPHSAFVEAGLQDGEFYQNVEAADLVDALMKAGWKDVEIERVGLDLRATARKPD
jgi:SAM-dependent methyltransferase